jgi:16S rRNA (cytidine1402-2'-O)-methyltransferase
VVFFEAPHRIRETLGDLIASVGDVDVAIGRELTKVHEEMVRGPISEVLTSLAAPRGEYTVVINAGQLTEVTEAARPSDSELHHLFGELTNNASQTRRAAVSALAKRYKLPAREVYAAIERARASAK